MTIGLAARVLALALAILPAAAPGAEEGEAPRAFVEASIPREEVFVGEEVEVSLSVGVEAGLLAEGLVPSTLRRLDLPVRLEAPWLREPPAGLAAGDPDPPFGVGGPTLALGNEVAAGAPRPDRILAGRTFRVFEVRRTLRAEAPGEFDLAAPRLRYAFAASFREDALGGRVPVDREEAAVEGEPLRLRVLPIPAEGRPAGFGGAVGRFTVEAGAAEEEGGLRLTLRIRGEGNLRRFDPPRPDLPPGVHLLGVLDDRGAPVRTVAYDLVREGAAAALPPIRLPFLDPGPPAAWREAATGAIPLPAGGAPSPRAPPPPPGGGTGAGGPALLPHDGVMLLAFLGLISLVLAAVWLLLHFRALKEERGGLEAGPVPLPPAAEAALHFQWRMQTPGADPGEALAAFLAKRLGCLPAAVITADLPRRLAAAGAPPDLARRTAELLDALVASRYGGGPVAEGAARAQAVVEEWDAVP